LRSTAIEKLNPFIDAITKLNGDTKMKLKKIHRKYGYSTRHFTLGRK